MSKKLKMLVMSLAAFALVGLFAACGGSDSGDFTGELTDAANQTLVVQGEDETMEFATTDETTYDYSNDDDLTVGDILTVSYHKDGDAYIADAVKVDEHKTQELTLDGTVSDLNDETITVSTDSLTVTFARDENTEVDSDLNEGDTVIVTYEGNLNENPYALKIEVTEHKADAPSYEAHGIISEVSDTDVLLNVDSSTAHRFLRNSATELVSSDNMVDVGDRAEITFTGDIDDNPVATKIVVHHQAEKNENVIHGELKKTEKTSFVLSTGKHEYKMLINEKTAFKGKKYQSGVKATVTYLGDLKSEPLAVSVYCAAKKKDEPKPTKTTKATEPTTATTESTTESSAPEPPTPPTPVIVTATGVIQEWDGDEIKVKIDDDSVVDLSVDPENLDIPSGYFPEVGDTVNIEYDKDKMALTKIQLIDRPDPDTMTPKETTEETKAPETTTTTKAPETTTTTKAPETTTTTTKPPETTTAAPEEPADDDD